MEIIALYTESQVKDMNKMLLFSEPSELSIKARSLYDMISMGYNIPEFIAFTLSGKKDTENKGKIREVYHSIISFFTPFDDDIIIRPTLYVEDSATQSFAGILHSSVVSLSSLTVEGLEKKVSECYEFVGTSNELRAYLNRSGQEVEVNDKICFIIQRFINGSPSGVMFTVNPVNQCNEFIIESTFGLNVLVTGGQISPDRFYVDKKAFSKFKTVLGSKKQIAVWNGSIIQYTDNTEASLLSLQSWQIEQLCTRAEQLEKHYGVPQDIEWIYSDRDLFILQTRAVSTLK